MQEIERLEKEEAFEQVQMELANFKTTTKEQREKQKEESIKEYKPNRSGGPSLDNPFKLTRDLMLIEASYDAADLTYQVRGGPLMAASLSSCALTANLTLDARLSCAVVCQHATPGSAECSWRPRQDGSDEECHLWSCYEGDQRARVAGRAVDRSQGTPTTTRGSPLRARRRAVAQGSPLDGEMASRLAIGHLVFVHNAAGESDEPRATARIFGRQRK